MNKMIALLLVLCLFLCACGAEEVQDPTEGPTESTTEVTEPEALVLYDEEEGYPFVNQERLGEIVETVELTTENWQDYIGVCAYTVKTIQYDAFGEEVSEETVTKNVLGAKQERYYHLRDFAIELKNTATGESRIYEGEFPEVSEDFDLSQYECTRIKGTVYFLDVPEEAIVENLVGADHAKTVERGFIIRYSDYSYGMPMSYYLRGYGMDGIFQYILY